MQVTVGPRRGGCHGEPFGLALAKAAALRITLNLDGPPITSKSHTHS